MLSVSNGINKAYQDNQLTGLVGEFAGKFLQNFGKGVGSGIAETTTKEPVKVNFDFQSLIMPVASGLILYFILKAV